LGSSIAVESFSSSNEVNTPPNARVEAVHEDGTRKVYRAGDAYAIAPGHDARVLGDEVAVCFEFQGAWGELG